MKKDKKQISEEELAAYIDGRMSASRSAELESSLTDDTIELLGVTRAAIEKVPKDNVVIFPKWSDQTATSNPFFRHRNPLAMAGFLGDEDSDDMATDESEDENNAEEKSEE